MLARALLIGAWHHVTHTFLQNVKRVLFRLLLEFFWLAFCLLAFSVMATTGLMVRRDDLDGSASPPGREDWRISVASGNKPDADPKNGRSPSEEKKRRSRSRSPLRRGKRGSSPSREIRYAREGTNTTSREPHMERARLFVGNIEPNRTHRRDLIKLFSQHGEVLGVSVHKGYAFVQMDRERTANKAINYEDNRSFMGSKIRKSLSTLFSVFFTCTPFSWQMLSFPRLHSRLELNVIIIYKLTFCRPVCIFISYYFAKCFLQKEAQVLYNGCGPVKSGLPINGCV